MLTVAFRPLIKFVIVALSLSMLTGSVRPTSLEIVKMEGQLTIVTRNSPLTYYEDRSGFAGYEYELAQAFAEHLGVELNVIVADNLTDIFSTLEQRKAAFAAAGLSLTPERQRMMRFSSPYKEVTELVIYKRGSFKPETPADLMNSRIMVPKGSSHAERLREWQQDFPTLTWGESSDFEVADIVHMVANDGLDFAIVDSNDFRVLQAYYPTINIAFSIEDKRDIAWAFSYSRDNSLYEAANEFIDSIKNSALIASLDERYYGHLAMLDYVGAQRFLRQTHLKLDNYKSSFVAAAEEHNFDWRLVAAVSYQESHWNPKAKSFTGVRGLMMLTLPTAKELGIKNRLDPEQSIKGGTLYLSRLRNRLQDVAEPDRTWMALAAYNVGFGHLQDARIITEKTGGNPNLWMDVKESLPLLSQKQHYRHTRHGYARGQEPVNYVQNIRRYYDVLVWNDEQQKNPTDGQLLLSANVTVIPPLL